MFTVTAAGTAEMDITAIFDNGLSYTVPASKYSGDSWRFFYYASVGFDAASQAICQTFYAGATLSIIPKDIRLNIEKLNDVILEENVKNFKDSE